MFITAGDIRLFKSSCDDLIKILSVYFLGVKSFPPKIKFTHATKLEHFAHYCNKTNISGILAEFGYGKYVIVPLSNQAGLVAPFVF